MQDKLRELAEQLYREGVDKGKTEATRLVDEARAEAATMLAAARREAERVTAEAADAAAEAGRRAEAEIRLAAGQALAALRQQVTRLVVATAIEAPAGQAFADPAFVRRLVETAVARWAADPGAGLVVELPEAERAAFDDFARGAAAGVLSGGLEIRFADRPGGGFRIAPRDGTYAVDFTAEGFQAWLGDMARPRVRAWLFGGET